ncbi:hypothetical protein ECANGB1_1698 [Enterospora canceri]|uniref:Mediator complex subunit 15 KIX domain-containing protein n=1 Tax=Enterospora canceri TaxID=1081671 RepID=A0A1Y1S9X9_9MICR|nr:hypothetical protein ECANGB1_1698 [Enterospora canceri]
MLIEALKEHPTFSTIEFSLVKEAVLNSEQQIFQNSKNRQEYIIAISGKLEQIKQTRSGPERRQTASGIQTSQNPGSKIDDTHGYDYGSRTRYETPPEMARHSNKFKQTVGIYNDKEITEKNVHGSKKISAAFLDDFDEIFSKRMNSKKDKKKEGSNTMAVNVSQSEMPRDVNFTINIVKNKPTERVKEERIQEKAPKVPDLESEVKEYIRENGLNIVKVEDENDWNDTIDFLLSLNDKDEMLVMQDKCRKIKFISREELENRITWYENNLDNSMDQSYRPQ